MTLGSGQCHLRVAAVQPHRTVLAHGGWPPLPGPQLLPVARALTLLEHWLPWGGRVSGCQDTQRREARASGRPIRPPRRGRGGRASGITLCLSASPDSGRAGWLGGRLESGPVPGTWRHDEDGWTGHGCPQAPTACPNWMRKQRDRGVQAVPLCHTEYFHCPKYPLQPACPSCLCAPGPRCTADGLPGRTGPATAAVWTGPYCVQ